MKELAEMDKVNAQLSAAIEEVTRIHREKAEVLFFCRINEKAFFLSFILFLFFLMDSAFQS